jgi:hypothetical protein
MSMAVSQQESMDAAVVTWSASTAPKASWSAWLMIASILVEAWAFSQTALAKEGSPSENGYFIGLRTKGNTHADRSKQRVFKQK